MKFSENFNEDLQRNYSERAQAFLQEETKFSNRSNLISAARLILVLFTFCSIWMFSIYTAAYWLVLASICFVTFFVVLFIDDKTKQALLYFRRLKAINEQERAALKGDYTSLSTGSLYSFQDHPYLNDLDIFGPGSLFQTINRTCTPHGEKLLANSLSNPDLYVDTILNRQKAIGELRHLQDFRQDFLVTGQINNETEEDLSQLNLWLNSPKSRLNNPVIKVFRFLIPAITITVALLTIFGIVWWLYIIIAILLNMSFVQMYNNQINEIHSKVSHKYKLLAKYSELLKLINDQTFSTDILNLAHQNSEEGFNRIRSLSKTMSFFDQRLNMLAVVLLNGFFLSDFHCIAALDNWKQNHKNEMSKWLGSIFTVDELNSFANFAFSNPNYTYPNFNESVFFAAEDLGHPLIRNSTCIKNNFYSTGDEKVVILTGANMSGKSTFLRSIGVNLILAYSGAPVYATKFTCSKSVVYSSMRVTDSLGQDTSYFYAELRRLSSIVKNLREGKKMFILLDEILKGTNSEDKLLGSIGLIEEFLQFNCLCVIATHDLALGELENKYPKNIINYCFESQLDSDRLTFDYTIKRGIAKNKNATFLMRREGLIK